MQIAGTRKTYTRWLAPAISRCLTGLVLGLTGATVAFGDVSPASCSTGTGVVVLVGQDTLYLNRPARHASVGRSVWSSLLASAVTGGSYLITLSAAGDTGTLVMAPATTAPDLQPTDVARSLAQALLETAAASGFDLLTATTHGEEVDDVVNHSSCHQMIVLNAVYSLEVVRQGLQLSLVAQMLNVSTTTPFARSTIAALEYRSATLPFNASNDTGALAAAYERWLVDQHSTLLLSLRDAVIDTAHMASHELRSADNDPSRLQLGKELARVMCDGCRKSDRVIVRTATRVWLQPDDNPKVLRSLPFGP